MKNIKIISVMSELGAGTRGSSLAFSAILSASLKLKSDFFNKFPVEEIKNENHYLFNYDTNSFAKNIDGIIKIYARLARKIKSICINNNFPIVISGDHSSAGGIIEGLKASHPNKKLGVIWIDAHADLHSPLTTPSGNMHGMPLSISLNDDNSLSIQPWPDLERDPWAQYTYSTYKAKVQAYSLENHPYRTKNHP